MRQLLAWLDSRSEQTFSRIKWVLSALSATLTSALILTLESNL